jgi:hypothetical protein
MVELVSGEVVLFHLLTDGRDDRRIHEGCLQEGFLHADGDLLQYPRRLIVGTVFHA